MPQSDILTMLHNDHRRVNQLFRDLETTTTRDPGHRQTVFREIDRCLCTHADFEERQVYPLLDGGKSSKIIMLEAVEEHLQLKRLLSELRDLDPQDERWMAKAQVLMEDVRHHMQEEEDEAFPQLRKDAHADTLQRLAKEYQIMMDLEQQQNIAAAVSKAVVQTPAPRSSGPNTTPRKGKQRHPQAKGRTKAKKAKVMAKDKQAAGSLPDTGA